jgi:hypothetical protein
MVLLWRLRRQQGCKNQHDKNQSTIILDGVGGIGKSYMLKAIVTSIFDEKIIVSPDDVLMTATTGSKVAQVIGGIIIYYCWQGFVVPIKKDAYIPLDGVLLKRFQE